MRFVFTVLLFGVCGSVFGQSGNEPVSVLKHDVPAVTAAATPNTAPVVVVDTGCRNGRCCVGPNCRLYSVEESVSESHRHRLFGGYVTRNTNRTVYRPFRR